MLIAIFTRNRTYSWRGRRIHHGLVGAWLTMFGLALMLDDLADCRHWWRDWQRRSV